MEYVFERKLEELLRRTKANELFPKLKHLGHWGRVEYQKRGLPHAHILIWVEKEVSENTTEWRELMDEYIRTDLDDFRKYFSEADLRNREFPSQDQLLFIEKMIKAHTHHHTAQYCQKSGYCRFGFPKSAISETHVLNGKVRHFRAAGNEMGVEHCPQVIQFWKGHANMTAVGEYSNITYLTNYTAKGEPLEMAEMEKSFLGDRYSSYKAYTQGRVVTTPEMVRHLLGYKFVFCSHAFVHLPTVPEEHRWRVVTQELRNPNFPARTYDNLTLYFDRPSEYATMTYQDFYENHSIVMDKDEATNTYTPRLRHRRKHTISIVTTPALHEKEKFWYHQLVTRRVWASAVEFESALEGLSTNRSYEEVGRALFPDISDTLSFVLADWVRSKTQNVRTMRLYLLRSIVDPATWSQVRERLMSEGCPDIGAYEQARADNSLWVYNSGCAASYNLLQDEQLSIARAFRNLSVDSKLKVLIEGPAGTGKSFLLKAIVGELALRDLKVVVVAPTGIAAVNVGGRTIHSQFVINTENQFSDLHENAPLLEFINNTHVLVIEEYSMVHFDTWNSLNFLFRRVKGGSDLFGGVNIICFGDRRQLPPVTEDESAHLLHAGVLDEFLYYELTKPMRSVCLKLDALLRTVSNPSSSLNQVKMLLRKVTKLADITNQVIELLLDEHANSRFITPHRAVKEEIYGMILAQIKSKYRRSLNSMFAAYDRFITLYGTGEVIKEFWIGELVAVTKNIDVSAGLVNGSVARIISLDRNFVTIKLQNNDQVHQVSYVEHKLEYAHNKTVVQARSMEIPLEQAYVSTVHKCQGQTLDKVFIDIRDPHFSHGMFYVALSRVRRIEDIVLIGSLKELKYVVDTSLFEDNRFCAPEEDLEAPLTPHERYVLRLGLDN